MVLWLTMNPNGHSCFRWVARSPSIRLRARWWSEQWALWSVRWPARPRSTGPRSPAIWELPGSTGWSSDRRSVDFSFLALCFLSSLEIFLGLIRVLNKYFRTILKFWLFNHDPVFKSSLKSTFIFGFGFGCFGDLRILLELSFIQRKLLVPCPSARQFIGGAMAEVVARRL